MEDDPARFLYIEPIESRIGWGIMEDFMLNIEEHEVRQALERALHMRKPIRSFKDELLAFPDTRKQWFDYHAQRMSEIAKDWLAENNVSFEPAKTRAPIE